MPKKDWNHEHGKIMRARGKTERAKANEMAGAESVTLSEVLRCTLSVLDSSGLGEEERGQMLQQCHEYCQGHEGLSAEQFTDYMRTISNHLVSKGVPEETSEAQTVWKSRSMMPGNCYLDMPSSFSHYVGHDDADPGELLQINGGQTHGYAVAIMYRTKSFRHERGTVRATPPELYRLISFHVASVIAGARLVMPTLDDVRAHLIPAHL